jgi:hypothetical protein
MAARAHRAGRPGSAAISDAGNAAFLAQQPQPVNICDHLAEQPAERHLIPDDKLALFLVPRVAMLAGRWQGPGTIAQQRRWRP